MALSVTSAGGGIGMLIIPHLLKYLIEQNGWRYGMMLLGCMAAQGCILGALSRSEPVSTNNSCSGGNIRLFNNFDFFLLFSVMFLWNFGAVMAIVFLADFAKASGLSKTMAAIQISLIGAFSVGVRLTLGLILKFCHVDIIFSFAIGCVLRGLGMALLPLMSDHFWYTAACCVVNGIGYGIQFGMLTPTFMKVFTPQMAVSAIGMCMVACGGGSLGGPPLAGKVLYTSQQTQYWPIVFAGLY